MDFYSAYAHGFARVAACTVPIRVADPATNLRAVLEQARVLGIDVEDVVAHLRAHAGGTPTPAGDPT